MALPAQPNQSLIDGLAVLQAVSGGRTGVGSRELGRELGLEATRVNRLLKTLAHLGLAVQDEDRRYRPGPAVHVLAAQALFGSGLLRRALPHLEALHRFDLIVAMGVVWRDQVSYLYHADPGMSAGQALGRAGLFPVSESGIGVALLARTADLRKLSAPLRKRVKQTRETGYALVPTGFKNQRSLGVALPDESKAAVALSGDIKDARVDELADALKQAVEAITRG